jgi:ATP-binding cassette subfamily B protein/subfamily B ATP-binding cassette protein MsbA
LKFLWQQFSPYLTQSYWKIGIIIVLIFFGIAIDVLLPWPIKFIVDNVLINEPLPEYLDWIYGFIGHDDHALLLFFSISSIILFVLGRLAFILESHLKTGVGHRMVYALGLDLFDHLQRLSLQFHNQVKTGDLVRRVTTDTYCIRDLAMSVFLPAITAMATLFIMFYIMWELDKTLAMVALFIAFPLLWIIKVTTNTMMQRYYEQQEIEGELMALSEQALSALPVVKAFSQEDYHDQRFIETSAQAIKAYIRVVVAEIKFSMGVNSSTAIGTSIIMVLGGFHVLQGSLSIGTLLVFLAYLVSLYTPMESLSNLSMGYADASGKAKRVFEILNNKTIFKDKSDAIILNDIRGHVEFKNVTFGYERNHEIIKRVSFAVLAGEKVAFVGPTGAGKSTLASLVLRFFDPWQGKILLDGKDLRDIQLENLRSHIALVLQEPFLLPMSVADNISYANPDANHDDIVAAAVTANAHDFIRKLPEGYETVLNEAGGQLSGGERQRIAIARAILKNSSILVLDEPTSALDSETEALVFEALEKLMKNRTTLIIAHRLSTIQKADKIVVIEKGQITAIGSHQQLMEISGLYKKLNTYLK